MPLLGGIFSRKNKSSSSRSKGDDRSDSLHSTAASDWDPSLSPTSTSSYVTPNRSIPSNPNAGNLLHPDSARQNYTYNMHSPSMTSVPASSTSASSSRLRLPFGRKKSAVAGSNPSAPDPPRKSFQTAPRPSEHRTSTDTESPDHRRLRPPPSRSAIFAAYGDPDTLSTRSLPSESSLSPSPHSTSFLPPPPLPSKKSLFGWGKNNPSPSPEPSPAHLDSRSMINGYQEHAGSPNSQESFNLRSFRHIRPPSPNGSNVSFTPPVPRPRGESINSDSAQRISVAAFREAQARRSQAGSPSPSFRDSNPAPAFTNHSRSMTPDGGNHPRPPRSASHAPSQQQRRRSSMAINTTTDSDGSASSSEEESEDVARTRNSMASILKKPGRTKAKSEAGHGRHAPTTSFKSSDFPPTPRTSNSHVGHSSSNNAPQQVSNASDEDSKATELPPRSQSSLSVYTTNLRKRASVSTSALTPSLAAKRASIVAATNARTGNASGSESRTSLAASKASLQTPQLTSQPSKSNLARSPVLPKPAADSDSDSDDDAPLATLVGPRRPGSAMSSYSNLHSRSTGNVTTRSATNMPPKPLIDINELTGPKRSHTSPLEKSTAGFTGGPTLLSRTERKPAVSLHQPTSPLVESPVSMSPPPWHTNVPHAQEPLTSTVAPVKFVSPIGTPAQEKDQFISRAELDKAMQKRASSGDMDDAADGRRDSSPEMRRDHITDRLTRAVKSTLQASSPSQDTAAPDSTFASTAAPQQLASASRAMSSSSGNASEGSRLNGADNAPASRARPGRSEMPFPKVQPSSADHSSQDEELARLLGTAVQFMSGNEAPRNRVSSSSSSSSESSDDSEDEQTERKAPEVSKDRIAPIPIKQRSPPPSFSVTSRPHVAKRENTTSSASIGQSLTTSPSGFMQRPRSTTLQASSSTTTSFGARNGSGNESNSPPMPLPRSGVAANGNGAATSASSPQGKSERSSIPRPGTGPRQRSSTMITGVPLSAQMNKQTSPIPEKPFTMRRNSPASSTGDSSSGRAPLTPRDGSDIGGKPKPEIVERPKRHIKRRSVSFEDDMDELRPPVRSYLKTPSSSRASSDAGDVSTTTTDDDLEERKRRERRRGEAKASIELGKVINGRGPVLDDDDEDMPINRGMDMRMSTLNPMMAMGNPMAMQMGQMGFGGSPNAGAWGAGMGQPMLSPAQFMMPPPADPNFFVAHQQAMAIAKQAYQMAVAQQAMAAAADEWERGSAVGGFGGGSTYGGGGGGSVYGGSQVPSMMGSSYGMMGGMGMMQGGWGSSASMYGGGGGSVYGGSQLGVPNMMNSSRSEYGGAGGRGGGGNWSSSKSSYGESFGPDQSSRRTPGQGGRRGAGANGRDSGYFPPMPPIPASQSTSGRNSPDLRPSRGKPNSPHRKLAPPSSWKAS